MGFKLVLVQMKCFVCWTWRLSLPCKGLYHYSCQVMKLVYMRSTCSVAVVNKGLKLELHVLKQFVFVLLTYILYVLNMGSKYLALQVMKFV